MMFSLLCSRLLLLFYAFNATFTQTRDVMHQFIVMRLFMQKRQTEICKNARQRLDQEREPSRIEREPSRSEYVGRMTYVLERSPSVEIQATLPMGSQ